jgi:uncharacterized protein YbjQ (UPF0145 family)
MDNKICTMCGKQLNAGEPDAAAVEIESLYYCPECADIINDSYSKNKIQHTESAVKDAGLIELLERKLALDNILLSTTNTLQGYKITEYIDVIMKSANIQSVQNKKQGILAAEKKIKLLMKSSTQELGGNAIIGVQFTCYNENEKEFSLGQTTQWLIAQGTVVKVEAIEE